ncbi:MAG TPA: hypothetical protein VIK59_12085 [Verrucomicrobiae bacterium]
MLEAKIIGMEQNNEKLFSKVPEITLIFWIIKNRRHNIGRDAKPPNLRPLKSSNAFWH